MKNHEKKRRLFLLFSLTGLHLFGLEGSITWGTPAPTVQTFPAPTVYTKREKGQGGAQTQSAVPTLNQSSSFYKLVYKCEKKSLKGPWESLQRTHTCSVVSKQSSFAWGLEAVKE